jgi:hypothetical protein
MCQRPIAVRSRLGHPSTPMAHRSREAIRPYLTDTSGVARFDVRDDAEVARRSGAARRQLIAWEFALPPSALH